MPEDKTPEAPTFGETPAEPTPEMTAIPIETPATTVLDDGAVSPEELATYSQSPVMTGAAPSLDPSASTTPSTVFGTGVPDLNTPNKGPGKKKLIVIGAIVVGALAILGGGSAAAYNFWYQNPERVVLEAASSLLQEGTSTHKITLDAKTKDTTVKLTVDAKLAQSPASQEDVIAAISYGGKDYKVTGSVLTDKDGNLYLKINDVKNLLTQFAGSEADFSAFNDVITKIDGQWVKISSDDLKSVSEDYSKTQSCSTTALKSLDEKATTDEILAVYNKNDFITVGNKIGAKTINGVGSLGYDVTFDKAKATAFYVALGDTKVGKALTACDSSFSFKASDLDSASSDSTTTTTEIQVWSSRFGHKLTELDINSKGTDGSTANIVWNPTFVKGVTVDAPATSVPAKEVITNAENDLSAMYSSSFSTTGTYDLGNVSSQSNVFKLTSLL
jgi:hypothetical protein